MKWLGLVLIAVVLVGCSQTAEPDSLLRIEGKTMGTQYRVTWPAAQLSDSGTLQQALEQRLLDINASMSTYDPESELSHINRMTTDALRQGIAISADLATVLHMSKIVHEQSGGAFDVTLGPLVNLWGFGPDPFSGNAPSDSAVTDALTRVNAGAIQLDGQQLVIEEALYIDLSAIAKGWAVNELASVLEHHGVVDFLVDIGGELYGQGLKPNGEPWRIAIERPSLEGHRQAQLILPLTNKGIATSGDYRNFFMHNGVRYSHTIDPRNGYPIRHDLASVTVVHESVGLADAWATALNVVGTEAAIELAEKYQLAVFILQRQEDGFQELASSQFKKIFADALP
ncbi:MAG: FAD:protein FMN transferase [Bacterioplanes sp.]|nr:FAD:protein FMN transferase [Bacterioplanes sp.]